MIEDLEVRRADGKDVRDEVWIPLSHTPDHRTAPVVAADDDPVDAELFADPRDGVGVVFEAEVVEIVGGALCQNLLVTCR